MKNISIKNHPGGMLSPNHIFKFFSSKGYIIFNWLHSIFGGFNPDIWYFSVYAI